MNKIIILGTIAGLLVLASVASNATPIQVVSDDVVAREASEAPRGADNNNQRRHRGGRVMEDAGSFILAREASEGPRGADNDNQRRRGRGGRG
jgi:hypothetical protein